MCRVVVGCALGCGRPHRAFRQENQLTALPDGMLSMPKLSWMGLAGNPLTAPTSEADRLHQHGGREPLGCGPQEVDDE